MKNYSKNISPDSLTGAIFAIEGIKDSCVILNGPTGCKFYHSAISDSQFVRSMSFDPNNYSEKYYFGQARVPSTYLDRDDYVYGSSEKLEDILKEVSNKDYKLIGVVNSPGAALIGDDLNMFLRNNLNNIPYISVENTGYSNTFASGYENAMIKVIDSLEYEDKKLEGYNINLLGFNIYQKYFMENSESLKNLLEHYNIKTICSLGAGDSTKDIKNINKADLNVVVYNEYGLEIAKHLKNKFNTPYLVLDKGVPIGFDSIERFLEQILNFFNIENIKKEIIEKDRAKAYLNIARFASLTGLPKGCKFSVKGESSIVYPLTEWLSSYMGMVPASIELLEGSDKKYIEKLQNYLEEINSLNVLSNDIVKTETDILLADANTIAQLKLEGHRFSGIEISLPSLGYIDVYDKTILSSKGALFLIEQILNGIRFLL